MTNYISEQEAGMEHHRERLREQEKATGQKLEQSRILEANLDKSKSDASEMKKKILTQNDKLNALESQLAYQIKENEDLKHDNTILYQKNVQNKERLDKVQLEIEDLKRYIESEKSKSSHLDNEAKRLSSKIQHLEDLLKVEKDRTQAKERAVDELSKQRDI